MAMLIRKGHTHGVTIFTDVDLAHRHLVLTTTGRPMLMSDGNHWHWIRTLTFFARGHAHSVRTMTGPALPMGNGMHYHMVNAVTSTAFTSTVPAHHHEVVGPTLKAPNLR